MDDLDIKLGTCFECGSVNYIHNHHVVPECLGGIKTVPLCDICHGKVHGRDFVKLRKLQKDGIERARKEGKYLGRISGTFEDPVHFAEKEKVKQIRYLLKRGITIRKIAKIVKASPSTVIKVKKFYKMASYI